MIICPWCKRKLYEEKNNKFPFHIASNGNWTGCIGTDFPINQLDNKNFKIEWISIKRPAWRKNVITNC